MIDWVMAETGESVLRENGRLLASRFDPVKEARDWLKLRSELLRWVESIFILGAGSAQAIREVLKTSSGQVYVVDANLERLNIMRAHLSEDRVHWIHLNDGKDVRAKAELRVGLSKSFVVLRHPASCALQADLYAAIRAQLLGRSWGVFNWQWRLRGGCDWDSAVRVSDGSDEPISICDLETTDYMQNSVDRERMVFKALRELVK